MSLFEEEVHRCIEDARRYVEKQAFRDNMAWRALTGRYDDPRWLERDYEDELNNDWTR